MEIKAVAPYSIAQIYATVAGMEQELILLRAANANYEQINAKLLEENTELKRFQESVTADLIETTAEVIEE